MTQIFLPKGSLMLWNDHAVTEHGRSPLLVTVNRIENSKRMADGTMRRYVVASKFQWVTSWAFIPDQMVGTVDGKWSVLEMENFYQTTPGAWTLKIEPIKGNVTFTDAGDIVTTPVPHKLFPGNTVQVGTVTSTAGITPGVTYYVLSTPTPTTLTLSATRSGATLPLTTNGSTVNICRCYSVMFTEFGKDFSKRGKYVQGNCNVTIQEV